MTGYIRTEACRKLTLLNEVISWPIGAAYNPWPVSFHLRVEVSLRRPLGAAAQARFVLALTLRAESAYSVDVR